MHQIQMANRIHWELSQWCVSWYWNPSFGWIIFLMAYFSRHQLKFLAQIILLLLSFFISVGQEQETVKDNITHHAKQADELKNSTLWITVSKQWLRTVRWHLVGYSIDIGKNSIQLSSFFKSCFFLLEMLSQETQP